MGGRRDASSCAFSGENAKSYKIHLSPLSIYTHNTKKALNPLTLWAFGRIIKVIVFRHII